MNEKRAVRCGVGRPFARAAAANGTLAARTRPGKVDAVNEPDDIGANAIARQVFNTGHDVQHAGRHVSLGRRALERHEPRSLGAEDLGDFLEPLH